MASVEDGIAAQIRNIETRYGRPMSEWFGLIAASGLTKHTEVVAMLKADYGLAHGAAHRVSLLSRQPAAPAPAPAPPRRGGQRAVHREKGKPAPAARPAHSDDRRPRRGCDPRAEEGIHQPRPPGSNSP